MLRERRRNRFHMGGRRDPLNTIIVVAGEVQSTITSSTLKVAPEHLADFTARYQKAWRALPVSYWEEAFPVACQWSLSDAIAQAHGQSVP